MPIETEKKTATKWRPVDEELLFGRETMFGYVATKCFQTLVDLNR
jgi:hypothetical protein